MSMPITAVDTQKAFEERYQKESAPLYRLDDTHWNPAAVRMTAALIEKLIPPATGLPFFSNTNLPISRISLKGWTTTGALR
jgi:hypothetical protein